MTEGLRAHTDALECDLCGASVARRGYAAHRERSGCKARSVERTMAERGWVRARLLTGKFRNAGCPLEIHLGAVGKRFCLVSWTPQWVMDAYIEGESVRKMMERLAPAHACVRHELALRVLEER